MDADQQESRNPISGPGNPKPADNCAHLTKSLAQQLRSIVADMDVDFGGLSTEIAAAADLIGQGERESGLTSAEIGASVRALVMRMQFADRLSQRLSNLQQNLVFLSETLEDHPSPVPPDYWAMLLERSRQTFTMEAEREEFDRLLGIQNTPAVSAGPATDNDVVLF